MFVCLFLGVGGNIHSSLETLRTHPNRTQIEQDADRLGEARFGGGFPKQLRLGVIEEVFPSAMELPLNHLDKHQMVTERK